MKNERQLLTVEDGPLMQGRESVRYLILHCSATRCDKDYTAEQLLRDHKTRGFRTVRLPLLYPSRRHHHPAPQTAGSGGTLPSLEPLQHRHLLRRGTGRQRPPARHSHACPEGCPHAVVARAGPPLPGSSHRRTPRLEPPKGLSFVRRSERIQERRTP